MCYGELSHSLHFSVVFCVSVGMDVSSYFTLFLFLIFCFDLSYMSPSER